MYRILGPDDACLRCGANDRTPYRHATGRIYLRCRLCRNRIAREYNQKRRATKEPTAMHTDITGYVEAAI